MAVYQIYINYFNRNGSLVTTEELVYEIPYTSGGDNIFVDPRVKNEMGKTGTFEFTVNYGHPYYDCWNQMKTMLRVTYYGVTIFYGRVLTIDVDRISGKKSIHCEGYLAFLMDSQFEGKTDDERPKISGSAYIDQLINNHNTQMGTTVNPPKTILRGYMPGSYGSTPVDQQVKVADSARYGSTGWQDTASAFSNLTGEYGGYLRTRYSDGNVYLDWLDNYFNNTEADRVIEVASNVINLNDSTEVDNIFTVVIPIGNKVNEGQTSDKLYLSPRELYVKDIGNHFTDEELNRGYHRKADYLSSLDDYGIIYKMISFPNAETQTDLASWAWDWIRENYHGGITSFNATALDLKIIGEADNPLLAGDRVTVRYPIGNGDIRSQVLTIVTAEYDLHHPEKNSYTIGIPDVRLNRTYGEKVNKKSSSSGGKGAGGGRGIKKPNTEESNDDDDEGNRINWKRHIITTSVNAEEYQAYKQKYGDEAAASIWKAAEIDLVQAESGNDRSKANIRSMIFNYKNGISLVEAGKVDGPVDVQRMYDYEQAYASVLFHTTGDVDFKTRDKVLGSEPETLMSFKSGDRAYQMSMSALGINPTTGKIIRNSQKITTGVSGTTGTFAGAKIKLPGSAGEKVKKILDDATGELKGVVNADGTQALIEMFDPSTVGETGVTPVKTVEQDGKNGGSVAAGSGGDLGGWKVTLNKPLTYTDGGKTYTVPAGSVASTDFHITKTYDSLKAKLLVVDVLLADYAKIGTLEALKATVDTITSNKITAGTYVSAASMTCTNLFASNTVDAGVVKAGIVNSDNSVNLGRCFNSAMFVEDGNTIKLQLSRANGEAGIEPYFNIAATNKYKTDVAAARANGRNDVYGNGVTLDPGESTTIYLKYNDGGNVYNTGKTISVSANSGGGGEHAHSTVISYLRTEDGVGVFKRVGGDRIGYQYNLTIYWD